MYQSPNNQPDPNQSFYNDQTAQFSQQQQPPPPPYSQPGQYPQYPMQQPPTPQKKSIWRWYRRRSKGGKVGIGCLALFIAFMACGTCSGITNGGIQSLAAHPTATVAVPTHVAQIVAPTHAPKPTPTAARPTPTPTPKPTTTTKPTAAPTAPPVVVVPTQPPAPPAPTAPPACSGVVDDGTCYSTDSAGGTPASTVPTDFCTLAPCVSTFWKDTNGSVALCVNGKYTHSYGVSGACSKDGGVAGQLYRH